MTAATLAPIENSPRGQDLTMPIHSMPLTEVGPLAPAHAHLSVIDAEGLHVNNDVSRLRLRLGELFDDQTIEATKLFENNCAHRAISLKRLR